MKAMSVTEREDYYAKKSLTALTNEEKAESFETYEEAELECLKKLIEIVKTKQYEKG